MARTPLLTRIQQLMRSTRTHTAKPKPVKSRTSSTHVTSASRDHAHELGVLWWRWRHCFLEAKRLEIAGEPEREHHAAA